VLVGGISSRLLVWTNLDEWEEADAAVDWVITWWKWIWDRDGRSLRKKNCNLWESRLGAW
jgi:hypothetical protein